ncbi:MAG: hypothetical protein ACJAUD_002334 [Crocinitomicaceae bacterium]|jgi:hypothetical protein
MQCTMYFFEIIMECVLIKSSEVRVCLLGVQCELVGVNLNNGLQPINF